MQQPNKIKQIICTGNLCGKETMDYFKSVCPDVVCTKGDFDDVARTWMITPLL